MEKLGLARICWW